MRVTIGAKHVDLPSNDRGAMERVFKSLLSELTDKNVAFLHAHPRLPLLYDSGIRYCREAAGREYWQDAHELYAALRGDCEDLACMRAAELRVRNGIHARPFLVRRHRGRLFLYHVLVQYPTGRLEDPSKILGMEGGA